MAPKDIEALVDLLTQPATQQRDRNKADALRHKASWQRHQHRSEGRLVDNPPVAPRTGEVTRELPLAKREMPLAKYRIPLDEGGQPPAHPPHQASCNDR